MTSKPAILFVPGAFSASSYTDEVANPLRAQGFTVLQPPLAVASNNPDTLDRELDHFDDVKAIHAAAFPLFEQGVEVILSDHSYGCIPGTAALQGQTVAERKARGLKGGFCALVRVAGGASPERGLNFMGTTEPLQLGPHQKLHEDLGLVEAEKDAALAIGSSLLDESARDAHKHHILTWQTLKSFQTLPQYAEKEITTIPKWFVVTTADKALPTEVLEKMAEVGVFDHVVRIPGDHVPHWSIPEKVVEVFVDVAKTLGEGKIGSMI